MSEIERLIGEKYTLQDVKKAMSKQTRETLYQYAMWATFGIDAIDWIIDCDIIVKRSNLTKKQTESISLIWYEGVTYKEAGNRLGVSDYAVYQSVKSASKKINKELNKQEVTM